MAPAVEGALGGQARPRLIITADDFGRDAVCTAAIADHLAAGRITAASIMANGACFAEACDMARARDLDRKLGVHLVFDEGPPVSHEMRAFADSHGNLCISRDRVRLRPQLTAAIEAESVAQVERAIAMGIQPTHLDSHRQVHTHFLVGHVVTKVARRFGIPYVRPARNLLPEKRLLKTVYKSVFNRYVASRVGTADYFGDIEDFFRHRYVVPVGSLIECMVHLDRSPRGLSGQQLLRNPEFQRFLAGYELVGHAPQIVAV
jgi:predicted glycoside hydrolase/deacetylase ChbG (UPF0249 family)